MVIIRICVLGQFIGGTPSARQAAVCEGGDERDRITYDSLWVHAKRHYDDAGVTAYWRARIHKELKNALGG